MTRSEWANFIVLSAYLVVALIAIRGIVRNPRLTVTLLGLSAACAAVTLAIAIRNIVLPGSDRLAGPAGAISFALSSSLLIAIIATFMLAWPLRPGNGDATTG